MTSVSTKIVFALLPRRLEGGGWVWLRRVVRRRTRIQNWAGILDTDQYYLPHRAGGR
jgi:hypothetical protein